ncbi:MAG: D-alanine--D-alanine ligase [Planctomycetes bacterium]|nr:D-alanine--D-alanine ligase [Planctomycetota bacterium]
MALNEYVVPEIKVNVLCGGVGAEREVSLVSGKAVTQGLLDAGWKASMLDVSGDESEIRALDCDAVFIALHGEFGEDGRVQAILEDMGMPFTGSGSAASALSMNKHLSKLELKKAGLPVANWIAACGMGDAREKMSVCHFETPFVVKPVSRGSSVGTTIVTDSSKTDAALEAAFAVDSEAMIEDFISGRELTIGFLGGKALPVIELKTKREFYDYQAKYHDDDTSYLCPAPLDGEMSQHLQELALDVCTVLGVEHLGRVDVILSEDGPMILEVNTIPGFTSHSLLPMAAKEDGLGFAELVSRIMVMGLQRAGKC